MIKVIIIFILAFALLFNSFRIIDFINSKEDKKIEIKKSTRIIISTLTSIFVVCLFLKHNLTFTFIKYILLTIYVMITGYIDYKTQNVYTFLSVIYLFIGSVFFCIELYNEVLISHYIIGVILTSLISIILSFFKVMNWGDTDVFIIISIFIGGFASVINIFISFSISIFQIIFLLITKRLNKNDRLPLCHYIAISTCFLMLFL